MNTLESDTFSGLAKIMPWPYLLCNRAGKLLHVNQHFSRLLELQYDAEDIFLGNIFSGDTPANAVEAVVKKVKPEESWHGKWHFNENGEQLTLELVVQVDPDNDDLLWVIALENPVINNQMVLSTRSELRLLQILMDHTLDYVFFKDISGRFIITNQAFQRALNVPFPGFEIGKKLSDFVDTNTAHAFEEADRRVLTTLEPIINHVEMFRLRNGNGHWLQTTKMPVFNQSQKCIGLVCVSRDISKLKENEEELKKAILKAEQANQAKGDFLANMSHEIRTPINGIVGMTELCMETTLDREQANYLKSVINCSNTLLALVNDILDFSKIEAGQLDLEEIRFNLKTNIEEIADQFNPLARDKGIELVVEFDPELPTYVKGDPIRLKQVLNNLLSNAVKFTEEGEIILKVEAMEQGEDQITLQITVQDTGIGIPQDRQELIFDSFTQADNSTTRKYGGTGLGLAICRRLVKLMGGDIELESEADAGATFLVSLKLQVAEQQGTSYQSQVSKLKGLPVLIIDDNETNRSILSELCRNWGFYPQTAPSGLEGLDILERSMQSTMPIRLVLLDQQMPNLSGLDVAALINHRPTLSAVKMILLSSSLGRNDVERANAMGISRVLSKPVKQSVLVEIILEAFGIGSAMDEAHETLPFVDSTSSFAKHSSHAASESVPMKPMTILLAEDNPVNQEVCVQRLERLGHEVLIVDNGQKAVEAYKQAKFDLILMDVQMPVMDGLEATKQIRKLEQSRSFKTPIIAMTARAMKGDKELCIGSGMDAYMAKPFRSSKLKAILKSVDQPLPNDSKVHIESMHSVNPTEQEVQNIRLDEVMESMDEEGIEDLIAAGSVYLEHYEKDIERLNEYLSNNDMGKMNHQAHSIKGGAGIFEAKRLQTLAFSVEKAALENNRASIEATLPLLEREILNLAEELKKICKDS